MRRTSQSLKGVLFVSLFLFNLIQLSGCGVVVRSLDNGYRQFKHSELFHRGRNGPLTETERQAAHIAWVYFENNFHSQTGLVNGIDGYPSVTMWEVADYLAALTAAFELDIIKGAVFHSRLATILGFLNTMELTFGQLPNKAYNAQTGKMIDYSNQPGEVGWSAVDLGRLLIWLKIIENRYPVYGEYVGRVILRWNFCSILDEEGGLFGSIREGDKLRFYQEGRLGYEEYSAKGFQLWGFDTTKASDINPFQEVKIYDTSIPYDSRGRRQNSQPNPVVSLGYFLQGLEFNWDLSLDNTSSDTTHTDEIMADFSQRIYLVQEKRWQTERIFTARTDHPVLGEPYFVYDTIFAAGYPWNVINDKGSYHKEHALVATKASFPMWSLWKTTYTTCLMENIGTLYNESKGWYEGRLESSGRHLQLLSLSTNAMVLESLLYKVKGKLLSLKAQSCGLDRTYYEVQTSDEFKLQGKCFPLEKQGCREDDMKCGRREVRF